MSEPKQPRVRWVDSLRGIAAISVAWFHLYSQNGGPLLTDHVPGLLNHASIVGRYGVELFFVISGFVLAVTLLPRQDVRAPKDVGLYFLRRSVRLDPPYLVVLALYLAAYPWFARAEGPMINPEMSWTRLFWNVFYFLPRPVPLYIPVAWTLAIEVQFYLLFAVMMLIINRSAALLGSRNAAILAVTGVMLAFAALPRLGAFAGMDDGYWMIPHLSTFAVGVTAAMVSMRIRGGLWLYGASLAIVAYGAATAGGRPFAALVFGLALIPVLASAKVRRLLENPLLLYLGAVSYCVYLLHPLVGSLVIERLQTVFQRPGYGQIPAVLAGMAATVAIAAILRQVIEKPAIAWSKKIRFGAAAAGPSAASELPAAAEPVEGAS